MTAGAEAGPEAIPPMALLPRLRSRAADVEDAFDDLDDFAEPCRPSAAPRPEFLVPATPDGDMRPSLPAMRPRRRREHPYRGALLTALACAAGIAVTWLAADEVLRGVRDAATWALPRLDDATRASVSVALAATGALALAIAWGRVTHPRKAVRLGDGRGTMAVDAIAGALRDEIEERADIRAAEVWVENRHRRGIRIHARLRVTRDARIDEVLEAVDIVAMDAAWRLGVALSEAPLVDVRYDELDLRVGRSRG